MKSLLLKIIVLLTLGGGAAFAHSLAAPFRLVPAAPERTVIDLPSRETEQPAVTDEASGQNSTPDEAGSTDASPEAPQTDGPIVLDQTDIDLNTARRLFEAGAADFIDARPAAEYEAGHIEGAMLITPDMLREGVPAAIDFLMPDRPIVVYCGGGDCHDSHLVVERLQSLFNFTRTHVFTGGYPEWEAAGLPTRTGPDPIAEFE